MRKKTKYTDEDVLFGARVKDIIPPPERLVRKKKTVKVTLELTAESLAFFKTQAKRQSVPYQRMIRSLIDAYTSHHDSGR